MNQILTVTKGVLERKLEGSLLMGSLLFLFKRACSKKLEELSTFLPGSDKAKVVDCGVFLNQAFHSSAC